MLFLLSFGLLFLTFLSFFLSGKRFYSPSFWLCFVFFLCSVFSVLGNEFFWNEPVSSLGPSIIFLSLFLFVLAEFLFRFFLSKQKKEKENHQESKFCISRKSKIILLCFSFVCFVIEVLNFRTKVIAAVQIGYTPWNLDLPSYFYRLSMSEDSATSIYESILYRLVNIFVFGGGFSSLFFLVYSFFVCEKKIDCLFFLPPCLLLLFDYVMSGWKSNLMFFFFVALLFVLFVASRRRVKIKPFIVLSASTFLILFGSFLFVFISKVRGSFTNKINVDYAAFDAICIYAGSPIVAFDKWLSQLPSPSRSSPFGVETFTGFYYFLKRFIAVDIPSNARYLETITLGSTDQTNVYTVFRAFTADFGLAGNYYIMPFLGFGFGFLFSRENEASDRSFLPFLTCILTFDLVYCAFTPKLFSEVISSTGFWSLTSLFVAFCFLKLVIFGKKEFSYFSKTSLFSRNHASN